MAVSIESRTPLLDYRLVELALRVPERLQFAPGGPKPLLREAVEPWIPRSVARRRDKRGFPTPLQRWKERPALRALVERIAADGAAGRGPATGVFAPGYLASVGELSASELWTVVAVDRWTGMLDAGAFARPRSAGSSPVRAA